MTDYTVTLAVIDYTVSPAVIDYTVTLAVTKYTVVTEKSLISQHKVMNVSQSVSAGD